MRRDGVAGVTVSKVTRAIGVHHTLFYSHFKTVDECLVAAAREVLDAVAPADSEVRKKYFRHDLNDRAALVAFFEDMLRRWLEHRPFVEVLLAHRLGRSAFAEAVRPALHGMRDEISAELWNMAQRMGVHPKHRQAVQRLAELNVASFLWALESTIDGSEEDIEPTADMLGDAMFGTVTQSLQRMLMRSREEMIADCFSPDERERLRARRAMWAERLKTCSIGEIVAEFGGPEGTVEALVQITGEHFIPEAAGTASAVVAYNIETPATPGNPSQTVTRWLRTQDGTCEALSEKPTEETTLGASMSLETFLQVSLGMRSFSEAFTSGDAVLTGKPELTPKILSWFYYPSYECDEAAIGRV